MEYLIGVPMGSPSNKAIGKALQKARVAAGFKTAKEFAVSRSMSVRTYTNYEQGTRSLSAELIWEFADAFGCSADELIGRAWSPSLIPASDDFRLTTDRDEIEILDRFKSCTNKGKNALLVSARALSGDQVSPNKQTETAKSDLSGNLKLETVEVEDNLDDAACG